ncbi:MAG: L,D-transpeptidase family protein [Pseudomonadota bacterium]
MTPHDIVVSPMGVRFSNRHFACTIGRGGLTDTKREGDGATPRGIHRIVGALYRPDRMAKPVSWAVPIALNDGWCDAPDHPDYNLRIQKPFAASHESLRRADPMYDLVLITDWNWPHAVAGRGSAIFIHAWKGPGRPTEGCIGFGATDLRWITQHLTVDSRLIVR